MAGVERPLGPDAGAGAGAVAPVGRAEGGGGFKVERRSLGAEQTEHGRRAVELAEPAPEVGVGDEAAPELADEGGADEGRGVVRREAEEDLLDGVVHQSWYYQPRRRHASHCSDRCGLRRRRSEGFGRMGTYELHVTCPVNEALGGGWLCNCQVGPRGARVQLFAATVVLLQVPVYYVCRKRDLVVTESEECDNDEIM